MMVFLYSMIFLFFVLSSSIFWNLWISLEFFSLYMSSFLLLQKNNGIGVLNYFFMQAIGSLLFFLGILIQTTIYDDFFKIFLAQVGLFMKLGAFPFHSWTLSLIENLNWKNVLAVMGIPKMSPLWGIMLLTPFLSEEIGWIFFFFMLLGGSLLPLQNLKTCSLRTIVGYSTIVHTAWLLTGSFMSKYICLFYFFTYLSLMFPLCFFFSFFSMKSMKNLLHLSSFIPIFFFASFSGIPPFLGFLPKVLVLSAMTDTELLFEAVFLGVSSVFPLYLYMKLFFFSILKSKTSKDVFFVKPVPPIFFFISQIYILLSYLYMF